MKKVNFGSKIVNYPMPTAVVGTNANGKDNYLTVAWLTMAGFNPPKLAICLGKGHESNDWIKKNGTFSVNFMSADHVTETDYVGIVSGKNVDKSEMFKTFKGELENAPLIEDAPLAVELKVDQIVDVDSNEMFIGTIVNVYADEDKVENKTVVLEKLNLMVCSQNTREYFKVGEKVGDAWRDGLKLKK